MKSRITSFRSALLSPLTLGSGLWALGFSLTAAALSLTGCTSTVPMPGINIFSINDYLGTRHEIARMDNRFERGLSKVTANYSKQDDGIKVVNRGLQPAGMKMVVIARRSLHLISFGCYPVSQG